MVMVVVVVAVVGGAACGERLELQGERKRMMVRLKRNL